MFNIFRKKNREEYEFLPDALEIVESPGSPLGSFMIWLIFIIIVSAIAWTYFGKVDIVATSRGKIVPNGNVKVVQAFEEGVVTGIYAEDGEKVKQGQLLMDLDTVMKDVDNSTYNKLLSDAMLEKEVLQCIVEGENYNKIADKYSNSGNKEFILKYYNSVISNSQSKLNILNSQLEQSKVNLKIAEEEKLRIENNIAYAEKNIENLNSVIESRSSGEEKLDLISIKIEALEKDEKKYKNLFEQGVIPENEWKAKKDELDLLIAEYNVQKKYIESDYNENRDKMTELENQLTNYQNTLNAQYANIELAKAEIAEIENNISNFNTDERKSYLDEIVNKENQITEYKNVIEKNEKSLDYSHIYATADGEIYGLTLNTIGAVVKPAESIMTIVPEGTELIVETMLLNKDIGYVEMGQEVIVKVDTYPFQKFGTIKGEVIGISPNAYYDENYGNVYKIKVRLADSKLVLESKEYNILSGMEVTAEVKTGERRIIDFFLETLVKYVDESIKLR